MDTFKTDEDLLDDYVSNGNQQAFKSILERYELTVCRMAASILGPDLAAESEDVAQEVFLRVHRGLPGFRSDSKFRTWLYRIAYNTSLSYKVRRQRQRTRTTNDGLVNVEASASHPSVKMDNAQWRAILNQAIDGLPLEYQSAIRLYYWYHVPIAAIAEQLGAPENTIKSYLHRARKLLAVGLAKYEDEK